MKSNIIYIALILIIFSLIAFNQCGNEPKIDYDYKYDSLEIKSNKYKQLAAVLLTEANQYKHSVDSLKALKSKVKYVKQNTPCDTVVMISEKIIERQDTVIVRLTDVITIKDSIIVNDSLAINLHLQEFKAHKKKSKRNIVYSFLIGVGIASLVGFVK